jgi:uncharacterized protein YneF (UPF0154 family)
LFRQEDAVEDEDLFFEDDIAEEEPEAEKPAPKAAPKKPAAKKAAPAKSAQARSAKPAGDKAEMEEEAEPAANTINLTVAVLAMVITFLLGFVGGTLLERNQSGGQDAAASGPPLTQEQIQQGQLPPGHIPIEGLGAGGTTATPPAQQGGGTTGGTK